MRFSIPFSMCITKRDKHTKWSGGRIALSTKYRDGKESIFLVCQNQKEKKDLLFTGPVLMHGLVYFPDRRRTDIHNYIQIIADGIEGVAYANDRQIKRLVWELAGYDKTSPRIEVEVTPLTGDGPWQQA